MEFTGIEFNALRASGRSERKGEIYAPPLPYGRSASGQAALQRSPILAPSPKRLRRLGDWPGKEDDIRERTVKATSGESSRQRGGLPYRLTKLIMDVP
jgi:hypothetical protein